MAGKYKCLLCEKEFISESGVKYHINSVHAEVRRAGPRPGGERGGRRGEDVPRACSGVSSPCSLLEQSWTQVVLDSLKHSWGAGVVSYRVLSQAAAAQISPCISRAFSQAIAESNLNPLSDT